jgi:hypothetical protein
MASLPVDFSYVVLKPKGEVVPIGGIDGGAPDPDAAYGAYQKQIDDLNAQGKLVVAPDGVIELGSNYPENAAEMSYADLLVAAGKMERIETIRVSFTVEKNAEVTNLLPEGKPVEKHHA